MSTKTTVTTSEVGQLVKSFLGHACNPIDHATSAETEVYLDHVDDADPDNLVVALSNGQFFTVRIIAGDRA